MIIIKRKEDLKSWIKQQKTIGKKIGFVPTMGALHDGHLSLLRLSKRDNDISVVSIFVNPKQFNNQEDLAKYPRTIEEDMEKLINANNDVLFLPDEEDIFKNTVDFDLDLEGLDQIWEGSSRPGHFKGVVSIVKILFDYVCPDQVYFGQKDLQQCVVIKRLIKKTFPHIKFHMAPIQRELNGLAMSSRNVRLSEQERSDASIIHEALMYAREYAGGRSIQAIKEHACKIINEKNNFKVDYFEIVNTENLEPVSHWSEADSLAAITAVHVDKVRLLDNEILFP